MSTNGTEGCILFPMETVIYNYDSQLFSNYDHNKVTLMQAGKQSPDTSD